MLKVWLPLDGDLRNLGCSDIEITNNGATINNAGKIGKCYSFDGTNDYIVGTYQATTNISFCCWVNFPTVPAGRHLFDARTRSGVGYQPMYINTSSIQIGRSGAAYPSISYSWIANTWYHICVTHNQNNGKLYINGELIATTAAAKGFEGGICNFTLGSRCNQSNYCSAKINDVRIYDHCLSAAEVKEIAQGLVVHYKLDASSEELITTIPSTNVYSYPTFNTSAAGGGWSHWGPSGHSGSYGQNTDKKYIYNKNNTYSHWVTEDAGTGKYNLLYQSPAFDGGYRSLQAIIKEENSLPIIDSICCPNWNARNGGVPANKWTSIKSLGDGFYYCCCEGISQSGSNDLVGIDVMSGYKIYVSECYLEDNTETCTPIFKYSSNIIQDNGGYGHNGTITGTIISQTESPRYNFSVYLNGSSYISTAASTMSWYQIDQGTLACWMKPTASMTGWRGSWGICQDAGAGSKGWAITDYDNTFMITYANGSTYKTATSGKTLPQNEWHHCAATLDGTTAKMYFDGELVKTVTIDWGTATMPTATRMELGVDFPGTDEKFTGNYSDARFYVTPLSDEDIKSLYNTSMKIDNLQNIHTFELIENQDKISITKTGQLTCDELNEDTAAKLYKSGIIETAELIER